MVTAFDQSYDMEHHSLYAAIKLAHMVQKVKDCLKSRIKKCMISAKSDQNPDFTMLTARGRDIMNRYAIVASNVI